MSIILNGTTGITTPDVTSDGLTVDSTTLVVDETNNRVGIGTSSPSALLDLEGATATQHINATTGNANTLYQLNGTTTASIEVGGGNNFFLTSNHASGNIYFRTGAGSPTRATIDSSGNLLVGKTALNNDVAGVQLHGIGIGAFTRSANIPLYVNRLTDDGTLVEFSQAGVAEGTISVSGTTVSYNGGHLSRWAQTTTVKDESLVKGTVLSNLDEMNVYVDADGNTVDNEQLNKVKVSDVEGDANVAGVFVNWTHDEAHNVDEINMAMTGDMIIRIASGVTVARGDLLMSAGDGTAKPQGDDIVRSKTIAKVTSTHVTCTYEDGSYCVPCVLMAC